MTPDFKHQDLTRPITQPPTKEGTAMRAKQLRFWVLEVSAATEAGAPASPTGLGSAYGLYLATNVTATPTNQGVETPQKLGLSR